MLYLLRLPFVVIQPSFHPRRDLPLENLFFGSSLPCCKGRRPQSSDYGYCQMATWVIVATALGRHGWPRASTDHTLHRSYFHAFTESILSPILPVWWNFSLMRK
jgi:hypothetical protein